MKKLMITLMTLLTIAVKASAMSYEQARQQALFLTDKMAYELNLTDDQYEAAYEVNLDYLMGVNSYSDLYGSYWQQRNMDLSYILLDWQYRAYLDATYFYRPLYWDGGYWHFGIYARYPHRDYYFFGRPTVYVSYRGGHSWYHNGGRSWYSGREYGRGFRDGVRYGMRDGFNRGDYGRGNRNILSSNSRTVERGYGNRSFGNQSRGGFGTQRYDTSRSPMMERRQSSTRATVTRPGSSAFGANRGFGPGSRSEMTTRGTSQMPDRTFSPSRSGAGSSFGPSSRSFSAPSRSSAPSTRSYSAPSRSSGSFGGGRSSFGGNRGGSFSGGSSHSGGSSFGGRR